MKIGIFGINTGACADPETAAKVAVGAEQIGVESLWTCLLYTSDAADE